MSDQKNRWSKSDVRTLIIDGELWFSMVDLLRSFGIDVSRRGASHQLRFVPSDHLRVVSREEAPDIFEGRGYSRMVFVSRQGATMLVKSCSDLNCSAPRKLDHF
ncbi:hypothetical protein ACRQ1B_27210 [Rhizobium panacihumi]|uniref:hypothetical protein n=1 Tax=Rhizobium panacihumi TaxID=2008450 RepID=UPI003D79CA94